MGALTLGQILEDLGTGALVTLQISVGAWLVAIVLGMAIAVGRDLGGARIRGPLTGLVIVLRSIPQLVLLYLIYFGLGSFQININPLLAAIVALGCADASFMAEYYRAGFLTIPPGQREAGRSLGLTRFGVLRTVVIPQAIPVVMAPALNSFVGLLKLATLASAIGVPEILYRGLQDIEITRHLVYIVVIIVVLYAGVTMPLTRLVAIIEVRVRVRATGEY